jgi:hypothetical protein
MPKRLLVLSGPDEGRLFLVPPSESLLLGRSRATENHLIDPHVSRVHCQVQIDGDQVLITDFDSAGGTFVNGKKITGKHPLKPGDLIRIGNTRLQYLDDEEPVAAGIPVTTGAPGQAPPASPDWARALEGKKISHFKLGSILAKGQIGYVFHACDTLKNLPAAVKVLDPQFSSDTKAVARFGKAMKLVMPLRHPNLIKLYGAGKTGPHCWIAMEYIAGESLAAVVSRIETTGMLDWRQVLRFAIYMSRALEFAHKKKLVHLNITPAKVLVGHAAQDTRLTDLMLARAVEGDRGLDLHKTNLLIELPFLSPERTANATVDARTDIYSLGATLYAVFSGQPPFTGETPTEVVFKIHRAQPVPLKDLFLGVPDPLEAMVAKMMARRPEDRYQTAKDMRKDLEAFAEEKGVGV